MKIDIEPQEYASVKYFSGIVEVDEKEYEFTLEENYTEMNDYIDIFITFLDDVPENRMNVEKEIRKHFNELLRD